MTTVSEIFETMDYGPAPESDAPAIEWIGRHGGAFGVYVGGRWVEGAGGEWLEVVNPATGKPLARTTQGGSAEVDVAVRIPPAGLDPPACPVSW